MDERGFDKMIKEQTVTEIVGDEIFHEFHTYGAQEYKANFPELWFRFQLAQSAVIVYRYMYDVGDINEKYRDYAGILVTMIYKGMHICPVNDNPIIDKRNYSIDTPSYDRIRFIQNVVNNLRIHTFNLKHAINTNAPKLSSKDWVIYHSIYSIYKKLKADESLRATKKKVIISKTANIVDWNIPDEVDFVINEVKNKKNDDDFDFIIEKGTRNW